MSDYSLVSNRKLNQDANEAIVNDVEELIDDDGMSLAVNAKPENDDDDFGGHGKVGSNGAWSNISSKIQSYRQQIEDTETYQRFIEVMNTNLIPDSSFFYRGVMIIEHPAICKFLKFASITLFLLYITHWFVRLESLDWEHDASYHMREFLLYDLHQSMLDTIVFFVIGRLHLTERRGIDQLVYILPMLVGMIYPSWTSTWGFLRHSVSMYEIMCLWPTALYEYVIGVAALDIWIIYKHVRHAYQDGVVLCKLTELVVCLSIFMAPMASDPSFHLHHWYAAWLLGMHANQKYWWSKMAQGFLWGMYINGIAVWGRDPILGCKYSYYMSVTNLCSYMQCYIDYFKDDDADSDDPSSIYKPFVEPDWHNCDASSAP